MQKIALGAFVSWVTVAKLTCAEDVLHAELLACANMTLTRNKAESRSSVLQLAMIMLEEQVTQDNVRAFFSNLSVQPVHKWTGPNKAVIRDISSFVLEELKEEKLTGMTACLWPWLDNPACCYNVGLL